MAYDWIQIIAPLAMENYYVSNVLPSVTIAQSIVESGSGKHAPGNNYFGIKGEGGTHTTQEFVNGQWITIQASFKGYADLADSVRRHGEFLNRYKRYANIIGNDDAEECCRLLQSAGYATDPDYASKLIRYIDIYGLKKYDKEAKDLLEDLKNRIAELEAKQSMECPPWAIDAIEAAVKAKLTTTPNGGSYDFYRIITILHRKGVI